MSPIGLFAILLINIIVNYSSGYLINSATNYTDNALEWKSDDPSTLLGTLTQCDPGQYETGTGCAQCKDYGAKCATNVECCLRDFMQCDTATKQCKCIDKYIWSRPTKTCYEGMSTTEIFLTLGYSFLVVFVIGGTIFLCRKPSKRFFERIRERREARFQSQVESGDASYTPSDPPPMINIERPLTIAELFARQQSTDTLPSPVTAYPPPQYAIPPEFYLNDQPPNYSDIPVSPPPNYNQAVLGFQFPAGNKDETLTNSSTNNSS